MTIAGKAVLVTGANRGIGQAVFDGLEHQEEDIFPDPMSQSVAEAWRGGFAKGLERQYAAIAAEFAAA